jgi:hypothetical protein
MSKQRLAMVVVLLALTIGVRADVPTKRLYLPFVSNVILEPDPIWPSITPQLGEAPMPTPTLGGM